MTARHEISRLGPSRPIPVDGRVVPLWLVHAMAPKTVVRFLVRDGAGWLDRDRAGNSIAIAASRTSLFRPERRHVAEDRPTPLSANAARNSEGKIFLPANP